VRGLRLLAIAALLVPTVAGCSAGAGQAAEFGVLSATTAGSHHGVVVRTASFAGTAPAGVFTARPGADGWLGAGTPAGWGGRAGVTASWFHDIGRGAPSEATDINDRGDVVGAVSVAGGGTHAFIMNRAVDGGRLVDITPGESRSTRAEGVNRHRTVVGTLGAPGEPQEPFVWNARTGLRVLPLPPGAAGAQAVDVNDQGMVLVVGVNASGMGMPVGSFVWDPVRRAYTALPVLDSSPAGAVAIARTLDERGGVAGGVVTQTGPQTYQHTAVVWQPRTLTPRQLPTGGATDTFATDRNAHGMIVGWRIAVPGGVSTAVYWPTPHAQPVELPGRVAFEVNDSGQIIGVRDLAGSPVFPFTAVMWEPRTGTVTDLGDFGLGSYVLALNASGRSAGYAVTEGSGQYHYTAGWWERPRDRGCGKHCPQATAGVGSPNAQGALSGERRIAA
jgi:uncharacterized membrane protein